jgi:hypothetical protein
MRNYISQVEHKVEEIQQQKLKKESLPPKHKKISMSLPKKITEISIENQRLSQLKFDLRCL